MRIRHAVISALFAVSAAQASNMVLPFIEDDYPKAREKALAAGLPLFIEAWAPW